MVKILTVVSEQHFCLAQMHNLDSKMNLKHKTPESVQGDINEIV